MDAAAGVLGGPLAGHTRRVQRRIRERTPFSELVVAIRSGPPRLSLMGLPGMDERLNAVEYFVHHEDIRRAEPGWQARELEPGEADALWHQLRFARRLLRRAPVGVEFARDDIPSAAGSGTAVRSEVRMTAKNTTPVVTVIGTPAELTLWAFGRTAAAEVRLDGTEPAIRLLSAARWGPGA